MAERLVLAHPFHRGDQYGRITTDLKVIIGRHHLKRCLLGHEPNIGAHCDNQCFAWEWSENEYLPAYLMQMRSEMRFIIAFDTMYGNTRKVAEYVASELIKHGHETELVDLRKTKPREVEGDVLLLGSPTRMGKMSRRAARFAKKIDHEVWKDRPMAVFDTILELPQDQEGRAKVMRWTENGAAIAAEGTVGIEGVQGP